MKKLLAALAFAAVVSPASAAIQTVTLDVPGMTCAACPITVKKALSKVDGVLEAKVSWEPRQAVVTYDDARTSPEQLVRATENAGYPSSVRE